jgi:tryptophan 2,3-dioxygenase
MTRIHAIERLMREQIEVLETMDPQDFLEFRSNLNPASGFQSIGFREIEVLSGPQPAGYEKMAEDDAGRAILAKRLAEPNLWDAFCDLLEHHGLPTGDPDQQRASLLKLARDRHAYPHLWYLAEDLLVHDELFALWRSRHVMMVERQIGAKTGTGGSSGVEYLRTTLEKKFYPELWGLRSEL